MLKLEHKYLSHNRLKESYSFLCQSAPRKSTNNIVYKKNTQRNNFVAIILAIIKHIVVTAFFIHFFATIRLLIYIVKFKRYIFS